MKSTFETVRAEALFVSGLQISQGSSMDEIRAAVTVTLRKLGTGECAALVAAEFGEYPEMAVSRMTWALKAVRGAYTEASAPRELALSI